MRIAVSILTLLVLRAVTLYPFACAQQIERVYPSHNHSTLHGVVETDDGRLYAAGANSTLLESSDGGRTWKQLPLGRFALHIHKLTTDGSSLFMLAYTPRHSGQPLLWPAGYLSQLFRYNPRSEIIEHLPYPLLSVDDSSATPRLSNYDLVVTKQAVYVVYSGFSGSRLLCSRDGGVTWNDMVFPEPLERKAMFFRTRKGTEDIMLYRPVNAYEGKLFLSSDFGASWNVHACPTPVRRSESPMALLWLRDGRIVLQTSVSGELMLMNQNGSWSNIGFLQFSDVMEFIEDGEGSWWAFTERGGCFRTDDEGTSWLMLRPERMRQIYKVLPHATIFNEQSLICVDDFGDIMITSDRGVSWDEPRSLPLQISYASMADSAFGIVAVNDFKADSDSGFWAYRITEDGFRTLLPCPDFPLSRAFPQSRTLWYAVGWNGSHHDSLLCRSTDGGLTWELALTMADTQVFPATIEMHQPDMYALVTSRGLLYTSDRGETWARILETGWTSGTFPRKVIITGPGKPIWMTTGEQHPFAVVRSNAEWSTWDTVLTYSDEEKQLVWEYLGIIDLQVFSDSRALTFAITTDDNALLHYSDDNGKSWQSWRANREGYQTDYMNRPLLLPGGVVLTHHKQQVSFDHNGIVSNTISQSRDLLISSSVLFEHGINTNIMESTHFIYSDATTAYFLTSRAVYRISLIDITGLASQGWPPLPLSIDTPYPHPISSSAGAVSLTMRSDRLARVTLTVHDLTGRDIARPFDGELYPGGRTIFWNTSMISPGTYILQLKSALGVTRRTVVVL